MQPATFIFAGLLVASVLAGYLFFNFHPNVPLKRRLWPWFVILSGISGGALLWRNAGVGDMDFRTQLAICGFFVLVMLSGLVSVRFCEVCGAAVGLRGMHFGRCCPFCDNELL